MCSQARAPSFPAKGHLDGDEGHAQNEQQDLEPVGRAAEEMAPEQEQEAYRGDQPANAVVGSDGLHVKSGQADDQEQTGDQPPVEDFDGDIDAAGLDNVQFFQTISLDQFVAVIDDRGPT